MTIPSVGGARLDDLLAKIATAETVEVAVELARLECLTLGCTASSFHIANPHCSQVGPEVYIALHGRSDEWRRDYYNPAMRGNDPFPDYFMRSGSAHSFADILPKVKATAEQLACIDRFYGGEMDRTIGIPAYGPFDLDSFVAFTRDKPFAPGCAGDESQVLRIVALVEITNRRIGQLLETEAALSITLSEREKEVLFWIARSKSNGDIATILDVSSGTVDTYTRRLFQKLDVNDRIAAAVKGLRLGLVRF